MAHGLSVGLNVDGHNLTPVIWPGFVDWRCQCGHEHGQGPDAGGRIRPWVPASVTLAHLGHRRDLNRSPR